MSLITTLQPAGALNDGTTIDALTVLQRIADRDIGDELLAWLCRRQPAGDVLAVALRTLSSCSGSDLVDRIFANPECLRYFCVPGLRRGSGQTTLRTLLTVPLPAEMFGDVPFSPAELFFRDLLRTDPVRGADRLVDHREQADISRPLAALCDVAFNPQGDNVLQSLWRLAELDQTNAILTNTLRAIPDFQRRMRSHFEQAFDRLASDKHAEVVARVRAAMDAAVPQPRAALPDPATLSNLLKMAPIKAPSATLGFPGIAGLESSPTPQRRSIRLRVGRSSDSIVRLVAGSALLLTAAFAVTGDIAAGTPLSTRLLSRGLSLLAAVIACATFGYVYRNATQQFTDRSKAFAPSPNVTGDALRQYAPTLALFAAYAVYDANRRYVGPLHFWYQSLIFLLNTVAIALIARAFEPDLQL